MNATTEFFSIGGNRNPAAADWDVDGSQLLAFGADNCIALWDPLDKQLRGIQSILHGHEGIVNAVKFFPTGPSNISILLSGATDNTLRIWRVTQCSGLKSSLIQTLKEHQSPITRISTLPGSGIFATGASDGTVKIWELAHDDGFLTINAGLLQSIVLSPRYFPLSIALAALDESTIILAVAGTRSTIQVFVSQDTQFHLAATLAGHEGWIRALDFTREIPDKDGDLLLASASQDKYIRLWRVHRGEELPAASSALNDPSLGILGKSLSNKAHRIASASSKYSITFEALLLGHEDWIYTSSWRRRNGKLQLLSTSEDNSLAIWEADTTSGVWVCITRMGEISAQKGSTSATGSAGGFWIGLWSPDSNSVVSLGRTGSWRRWAYSTTVDMWEQQVAITGHTREVKDLCWSKDGNYLLSTGSDQTTRLFSEWKRNEGSSWHEFSRPQIHGYDLNCIGCVSDTQFVSGADEKLLRVFDEPKGVSEMLKRLCKIDVSGTDLPDAANIPVLGLSNKAIQAVDDEDPVGNGDADEREAVDPASIVRKSTLDLNHPPFEDHLARHLLWPETEKLYGHGYEISAVAISNDGGLVATTCRASSIDHAVIRLYDSKEWLEIKPPLKAHSLTVTALQFSHDDRYLLSVGRDRQWVVWERNADASYELKYSNPKGHTRMVLGASWTPLHQPTFLTAGRDKNVKIWQSTNKEVVLKGSVAATAAVTAVACNRSISTGRLQFAFGTEIGEVCVCFAPVEELDKCIVTRVNAEVAPAKTINQIAWRPARVDSELQIAVASDDSSVRVFKISMVDIFLLPFLYSIKEKYKAALRRLITDRLEIGKNTRDGLFSFVAEAKDPETGAEMSEMDLFTEAEFFLPAGMRNSIFWRYGNPAANAINPAGGQTTASAIAALFFYLTRYSDCYKRLADEICSAFTNGGEITNAKIFACSYLRACIDEELRMSPPAPGTLWRELPTNTPVRVVVDGHSIPNGTIVGVSIYAIQHNEEYFGEPFSFKPE